MQVDAAGEGGEGRGSLPGNAFQKFVCVVAGENVQLTAQLAVHGVLHNHVQQGAAVVYHGVELFGQERVGVAAGDGVGLAWVFLSGQHVPAGRGGDAGVGGPQKGHVAHHHLTAYVEFFGQGRSA